MATEEADCAFAPSTYDKSIDDCSVTAKIEVPPPSCLQSQDPKRTAQHSIRHQVATAYCSPAEPANLPKSTPTVSKPLAAPSKPHLSLPYLPGEIRNQIYSHLLAAHQDHCYDYGCPSRGHAWLEPILLVNRQISSELKWFFRREHIWVYTDEQCFDRMHLCPHAHHRALVTREKLPEPEDLEARLAQHVSLVHEFSLPAEPVHVHFVRKMAHFAAFKSLRSLELDYWHLHRLYFDAAHCCHMRERADIALQAVLALPSFDVLRVRHDLVTVGRHRDPQSGLRVRVRVIWTHAFTLDFGNEGERVRLFYHALLRQMGFQACDPKKERGLFIDTPRWRSKTFDFSWDAGCLRGGARKIDICWDRGFHSRWETMAMPKMYSNDDVRITKWVQDKWKDPRVESPEAGDWLSGSDLQNLFGE